MHDLHLLDEFCQMLITACQREHFREDSVVLRRQARQTGKACQLLVGHEAASPTECGHCHLLLHRIVKDGILLNVRRPMKTYLQTNIDGASTIQP
jgi:hypothetical protein